MRRFASKVGSAVCVGSGGAAVGVEESVANGGGSEEVGVHSIGWNGVGVGEAFGAIVTSAYGRAGCSVGGALVPHPASDKLATTNHSTLLFMIYGNGVIEGVGVIAGAEVSVGAGMGEGEAVDVGEEVEIKICVAVGTGDEVTTNVGGVNVNEAVEEGNTSVEPGGGVLVGTLGTHSLCPV